jgi:hypothetical protein
MLLHVDVWNDLLTVVMKDLLVCGFEYNQNIIVVQVIDMFVSE